MIQKAPMHFDSCTVMARKRGRALIDFNRGLDPALIQDLRLFEYWFHTKTNILIIIYALLSLKTSPYSCMLLIHLLEIDTHIFFSGIMHV